MSGSLNAVLMVATVGLATVTPGFADDALLVPPAPAGAALTPPVPIGPYDVYDEPVFITPAYFAPVYVAPAYVQPVVPAPVVVSDWYAPTYVVPGRVSVWSSPWSYKTENEYATPFGSREIEYRVDRFGRVRVEYDD